MIMKKMIFFIIGLSVLLSCSEEVIKTYDELTPRRYIQFMSPEKDSVEISFFFFPGSETIDYPLPVQATGYSSEDEQYKISIVKDYTTAPEENYKLAEIQTFRSSYVVDTAYIKLVKSDFLNTNKVRVVLEVVENGVFLPGRKDHRVSIVWFHNIISQPEWWTLEVSATYLGRYSDKKYKLFLDVVGVDLREATSSEIRNYALHFKKYLNSEKEAGRTVYEDDGTEMVVSVLGNLV